MKCSKCKNDAHSLKRVNNLKGLDIHLCSVCHDAWENWLVEAREVALILFLEDEFHIQPERLNEKAPKGDAKV